MHLSIAFTFDGVKQSEMTEKPSRKSLQVIATMVP